MWTTASKDKGREQANKTGVYLLNTFGKFDKIYSSPIKRCIQTSNIIAKEVTYTNTIITDDDLIENGAIDDYTKGLNRKEIDEFIDSVKNFRELEEKIKVSKDPYERYLLDKELYSLVNTEFNDKPTHSEMYANCENFLEKLKKTSDNQILVIAHGAVLLAIQRIICNMKPYDRSPFFVSSKPYSSASELFGNCACLYVGLENNEYILVESSNTSHLKF